jgi:hypothetical protein
LIHQQNTAWFEALDANHCVAGWGDVMPDDDKLDEVKTILRRLQRIGTGEDDGADPAALEGGPPERGGSDRAWSRHGITTETAGRQTAPAPHEIIATGMALTHPPASRPVGRIAAVTAAGLLLVAVGLGVLLWPDKEPPPAVIEKTPVRQEEQTPQSDSGQTVTATATPTQHTPAPQETAVPEQAAPQITGADLAEGQSIEPLYRAQRLIADGKIVAGRELLLAGPAEQVADAALALARSYDPNSLRLITNADAPANAAEAERWYRRWHELAALQGLALDGPRLDRIIKAMK